MASKVLQPRSVQLISLGCSKNRVYSEKLLTDISEGGLKLLPEGVPYKESRPDVVIVNTCGFIGDAKEESVNEILRVGEAKKKGFVGKIVVCGCLSERYKDDLIQSIPEVDAFFGAFAWRQVIEYLGITKKPKAEAERVLTTPSHYAYLNIADGCNRKCAYCAIPLIKGPYKSEPIEAIVKETKSLASKGVKELILLAQDTTFYGVDLYGKRKLGALLKELCRVDGVEWIRVHYSYPLAFPKDCLKLMASEPKICNYLDIPLQHASSKVLKMMRRGIDHEKTQKIIDDIRAEVPDIALRTTLIVGHPGEGAAEFQELMRFVKHNRFEMLGAFTYSEEEGTYAAKHYKDSVPQRVKESRYNKLMLLQKNISLENNKKRIGEVEKVIIDEYKNGFFYARSQKESPEVDGNIIIKASGENANKKLIGTFAAVKIVGAGEYDLRGEFV